MFSSRNNHSPGKRFYFGISVIILTAVISASALLILTGGTNADDTTAAAKKPSAALYGLPAVPSEISIFGEKVPLDQFGIRERFESELLGVVYSHSSTIRYMLRSGRFFPDISAILKEQGMPDDFKYLCVTESGLANAISPKNAVGFWQFLSATGVQYGLEITNEVDERYDFRKSTVAASKYLKEAYGRYKNWTLAAASYNMGMGGVSNSLNEQLANNYYDLFLNEETSRYILRIAAVKLVFENPEAYGFGVKDEQKYQDYKTKDVTVSATIDNLVTFARQNGTTYYVLKSLNPWLRSERLSVRPGKSYILKLPA